MNTAAALAPTALPRLGLVCAASHTPTLQRYLLQSPSLVQPQLPVLIRYGASSAAAAFNPVCLEAQPVDWWVWVHQDVLLPGPSWFTCLAQRLQQALALWPQLAVAGAYGIALDGQRAGCVLDRGRALHEPCPLPVQAQALDEMLLLVRASSALRMDAALGFDFYGTDLALQAEQNGYKAAVLEIDCEHWSSTPSEPPFADALLERIARSASVFERKWKHRLPITTPCLRLDRVGAAQQLMQQMRASQGQQAEP